MLEEGCRDAGAVAVEVQSKQSNLRRGWYFGSQAFGEWLLERAKTELAEKAGNPNYGGQDVRAHDELAAERI